MRILCNAHRMRSDDFVSPILRRQVSRLKDTLFSARFDCDSLYKRPRRTDLHARGDLKKLQSAGAMCQMKPAEPNPNAP
jgi:hypothetical protein